MACGALVTFGVATVAQIAATLVGFVLALVSALDRGAAEICDAAFIWIFRGTPPLIQLLLFYFGLPQLGLRLSVLEAGLLSLSLYGAAYMAEIMRAGARLPRSRPGRGRAKHRALARQTMRNVILPQAMRVILPTLRKRIHQHDAHDVATVGDIVRGAVARHEPRHQRDIPAPRTLFGRRLYYLAMTTALDGRAGLGSSGASASAAGAAD